MIKSYQTFSLWSSAPAIKISSLGSNLTASQFADEIFMIILLFRFFICGNDIQYDSNVLIINNLFFEKFEASFKIMMKIKYLELDRVVEF